MAPSSSTFGPHGWTDLPPGMLTGPLGAVSMPGLRGYILKRLLLVPVTLVLVSLLVFALAQLVPGDVGRAILGPYATAAQVHRLDVHLGYDRPLLVRYWQWISGFVTGNWGSSPLLQVPIRSLIGARIGNSLLLAFVAFVIVVPVSVTLGVVSGLRPGSRTDRAISVTGLAMLGMPEFVGGTILLVVVGVELHWLPTTAQAPPGAGIVTRLHYVLLPALALVPVLLGYLSRMARAGTAETAQSQFVRTATLKGLPRRVVLGRHLLPNALLPTMTVVSVQVSYLVGGLVVIEELFNYPGIGKLFLNSALTHDIPTLADVTMLLAAIYLIISLLADIGYAVLDPRIRLAAV
jgi:peptide/nickel transport system permease protein